MNSTKWVLVPAEPTEKQKLAGIDASPLCIKRMYEHPEQGRKFIGQISSFDTEGCASIYKAMLEAESRPFEVYAFEYTSCRYESAFGVVSLHSTKQKAYRAMVDFQWAEWENYRKQRCAFKFPKGWNPVVHALFRVRALTFMD